jgi:heterodisulfide reductase subunit B
MEVGYYPGCSLEATARDYRESLEAVCQALEVRLVEVEDWNCCGASAAHSLDHRLALNLGARNLVQAAAGPQPVVVPCALCFNRLKTTQYELAQGATGLIPELGRHLDRLARVEVVELNQFLTRPELVERTLSAARHSLAGLRPVVYYGCQGQRPPQVTGHPRHEDPQGIDQLLSELGAEVVDWPYKTDCCGASFAVSRPEVVFELVGRLYLRALERGANCIVTGCQMCQANLDLYQDQIAARLEREVYLPVFYFTELMGLALGLSQAGRWLRRHLVDPRELLAQTAVEPSLWGKP